MNNPKLESRRGVKLVAWTNIIAQIAFPVAAAFTPSSAVARSQQELNLNDSELAALAVKPYTLQDNETVQTVADRFSLTVGQLKKLNQLRTFSTPFEHLGTGAEIDVPASPLNEKTAPASPFSVDNDSLQRDIASASTRTAGILQSSDISGSLAGQAKSMVVEKANQEINSWLSGAGTAKAKLNIDNKGRIDGTELDMLIPLRDTPSSLTFTQFGARHINDRTMANLGLGQRHYIDSEWMFGYNAFFDYDLRRDHSRAGFGLELARDYLKFGANSYFRTSNWRASPDVTDYDERPANGFDIRTEAWLPAMPQLGASLAYEQYYGEDVGLFGKNSRSRNPAALTAGLSYTPFPLLTIGVDRKQGTTAGEGETRFSLGLNYDLGGSWLRQTDPDSVGTKRTLAGSRYDLVDRNNEIVLEYRKQELIRLKAPSLISGQSGETKSITLSVRAKYGLDTIRWDDAALVAAGGSITGSGQQYNVVLPPYAVNGANTVSVYAVAVDKKGNISKREEVQISVLSAGISAAESVFDSDEDVLPADATSTSRLILKLEDAAGNPITGLAGEIVLKFDMPGNEGTLPEFTSFRETSPGVYESTMTTGTRAGTLVITPTVQGTPLAPVTVDIVQPAAPSAVDLRLSGQLSVGSTLTGSYRFVQSQTVENASRNIAKAEDASRYAWGEKGSTAERVSLGKRISKSGEIDGYVVTAADAGKFIELSLLPANTISLTGKILTVDTSMSKDQGNDASDGSDGLVIDPTAAPSVSGLKISGSLLSGNELNGQYTFDAGKGNNIDESLFLWGVKGTTASAVEGSGKTVTTPGAVEVRPVTTADAGQVIELSVMAKNKLGIKGNTLTDDTQTNGGAGQIVDGNNGQAVDANAAPSVSGLKISGSLLSGNELNGQYTFDAGKGNNIDESLFLWGVKGTTASAVEGSGKTVTTPGAVEVRPVTTADAGQVIELSVMAKNKLGIKGNTLTDDTQTNGGAGQIVDGNNGQAIDANAIPKINNLVVVKVTDLLPNSTIKATYDFDAANGDPRNTSTFAWSNQSTPVGSTASAALQGITVDASGKIDERLLTNDDVGEIVEISVSPRNGRNTRGTTVTAQTKHEIGLVLTGSYFTGSQNGGQLPGVNTWIWIKEIGGSLFATGQFTFTSTGFTSTTTNGTLYVNADDSVDKVVLNGTEINLGGCKNDWAYKYCTATVTNLKTNGPNSISVTATNRSGQASSNPGSLGVVIQDASSNPIITTNNPSDWTYE
ncbi:inverse autotransporter beta domain-containing protein (plasmid) [Enterobacter sp. D2]|uniref:inverse autotransporter beta domain-containing protein n=1 Tax=Enterobacter sp. D2 TaxID=3102784 RepID=UPI002ACAE3AF|nr:inverse autotransporter beta domain-containing protein [Enterobacter sp. D2]MDZ5731141.1 inverse autotransporter beta domain-containing protein [Enterobacter sp. D2]